MSTAQRENIARWFSRMLEVVGPAVVVGTVWIDRRWLEQPIEALVLIGATIVLRSLPVRLSKFSYLTQTGLAGLVAAVTVPPSTAVLGLWLGVFASDRLVLRKPMYAAMVNSGREVMALALAFGPYVATAAWLKLDTFSLEFLPAVAVLTGGYFFSSRIRMRCSIHNNGAGSWREDGSYEDSGHCWSGSTGCSCGHCSISTSTGPSGYRQKAPAFWHPIMPACSMHRPSSPRCPPDS